MRLLPLSLLGAGLPSTTAADEDCQRQDERAGNNASMGKH